MSTTTLRTTPSGAERPPASHHVERIASARLVFIDLARTAAIVMMLQGHTLDALLATDARSGTAFETWSFVRGLTSSTFLLLSGFVFALATRRHWTGHTGSVAVIGRRFRRFGFFLLLGYALHFPTARVWMLGSMSAERWPSFLMVDVLQCIAVTLASLQAMVLIARTPGRFTAVVSVCGAAVVLLTPAMWRIDWAARLPLALASYLSPATGSLFPLFPWSAYILLGAVLGSLYVSWGAASGRRYANRVLLGGGAGMLIAAIVFSRVPVALFGDTNFWSNSPNQVLMRSGLVLLVLGVLAHVSRLVSRVPPVLHALAQESLTIYAVHLCIVYGSVWSPGLRYFVGPTLELPMALVYVAAVWTSMAALAFSWYRCKLRRPVTARWIRLTVAGLLVGRLL